MTIHANKDKDVLAIATQIFTQEDMDTLNSSGVSLENAVQQFQQQHNGIAKVTPTDAVTEKSTYLKVLSEQALTSMATRFDDLEKTAPSTFFIPAAGAASRMFQLLKKVVEQGVASLDPAKEIPAFNKLTDGIKSEKMAFTNDLHTQAATKGFALTEAMSNNNWKAIFSFILKDMDYENLPKAVIPTHRYSDTDVRTPIEEHIRFTQTLQGNDVRIHMAISEEHTAVILAEVAKVKHKLAAEGTPINLNFSYSYQEKKKDAIAYDADKKLPQHDPQNGRLVVRKAGHGALIENVNNIDTNGEWLRNIDNIRPSENDELIATYKKAMRVMAYDLEQKAFDFIKKIDQGKIATDSEFADVISFIHDELKFKFNTRDIMYLDQPQQLQVLRAILNRPIAVVGYVPLKEGEKGGGGFVVPMKLTINGVTIHLEKATTCEGQELEGGQKNPIFAEKATHFNPVDLYITKKDFTGKAFNLTKFVDMSRSMVDDKTLFPGIKSKIWEWPGLWNGSMAEAFQVSIALPRDTFAPVKEFHNVLDTEHVPGVWVFRPVLISW